MNRSQLLNKAAISFFAGLATAGCIDLCGLDPLDESLNDEDSRPGLHERRSLKELATESSAASRQEPGVFVSSDWSAR